jgi:predicted TPR repeat methyltransferase
MRARLIRLGPLSAALLLAALTARAQVPYVPTPANVVQAMLEAANVQAHDVVYDLGCGDGRIVIAAAERFGARGIGVDISAERIREANENARAAGVLDKVKFLQQDLFETDIFAASVVMLYLVPRVNLMLRPKLLRELAPGTRVVSHNYDMGDWKPQRVMRVGTHRIYVWVIPPRS